MDGFVGGGDSGVAAFVENGRYGSGGKFGGGGCTRAAVREPKHFAINAAGALSAIVPDGPGDEAGAAGRAAGKFAEKDVGLIVRVDWLAARPDGELGNSLDDDLRCGANFGVEHFGVEPAASIQES